MFWILLCAIIGSTIVVAYFIWRKWIAPWRKIEQLVKQVGHGDQPGTFLIEGSAEVRRVSVELENIFTRQRELNRQIGERASGQKAILSGCRMDCWWWMVNVGSLW